VGASAQSQGVGEAGAGPSHSFALARATVLRAPPGERAVGRAIAAAVLGIDRLFRPRLPSGG